MIKHDLVLAVKELIERNWNADMIASKLWTSPDTVQTIIDMIQGTVI